MSVNFVQLLQESGNFIRNQKTFSLTAILVMLVLQVANVLLSAQLFKAVDPAQMASTLGGSLFLSMVFAVFTVYFSLVLVVLNIKKINEGQYHNFFEATGEAFSKLFPVIGVIILMSFPLSFGIASAAMGGEAGSGLGIVALPLLAGGIFIFLKLCLGSYALLVENMRVGQAVKFSWQLTKGKMLWVIGYVLIAYVIPMVINAMLAQISANMVMQIIAALVGVCLSLFTVVFGFRFYQTLRSIGEK